MIKRIIVFNVILSILLAGLQIVKAQQNLFNIPSGDITHKGKLFYQHQINVYNPSAIESKWHFVYGLGKGWDAGINIVNTKFNLRATGGQQWFKMNDDLQKAPVSPLALLTLQKGFQLTDKLKVNVGTQAGTNLTGDNHFAHLTYSVAQYEFAHHIKLVAGPYWTNAAFVGIGNGTGLLVGYEIPLSKRWYLMGDFITGNHSNSVAALGGMYNLTKRIQLCAGAIIPNFNNVDTPFGMVFEINILGWDIWNDEHDSE
jgi:hypothetical protein